MCNELTFQSSLSNNEIDRNFENVNIFKGIMDGLHEALAYEQGEVIDETVVRTRLLPNEDSSSSNC